MADSPAPRFLGLAFVSCLLLLTAIAVFNWHTNPGGLFQHGGSRPEQVLGGLLASGWNVATDSSFDERILRQAQIAGTKPNRGTVVFGSSRVMEIRPGVIPTTGDFQSNWVGSANLEDDFALLEMHLEHGAMPRKIILGLDPWIFNAQGTMDPRSGAMREPMSRLAARMKLPLDWTLLPRDDSSMPTTESGPPAARESLDVCLRRYAQLISWGYFSQSLLSYFQKGAGGEKTAEWVHYRTTHDDWNDVRTYRADGSMGYDKKYRDRPVAEVEADALQYANPPVFKLDGFTRVDPKRAIALGTFLDFLQSSGIEVQIYLPPYHPVTYAALMKQPLGPLLRQAEAEMHKMAAVRQIPVVGSYDPDIASCGGSDFYDGMHLKKEAVTRVLSFLPQQ